MEAKPNHLGLKYAEQFKDTSIAEVYHYRPPYPDEAISQLIALIGDETRTILDVGCGTGDLCRRLVNMASRVDAVDFSHAMIDKGKTLPNGDHPHLHWMYGRIEEVVLHPPYSLVTAGESLHWMDWDIALPLFHHILTPHGSLAIIERRTEHNPWDEALQALIERFSTNQEYQQHNLLEALEQRHLFQKKGTMFTQPTPFVQTGEEYLASIHSRNGFSRERMGETAARAFDEEVEKMLQPFLQNGSLTLSLMSSVVWGAPQEALPIIY